MILCFPHTRIPPNELLDDKTKLNSKDTERVIFSVNWHPQLAKLPGLIKKHFYLLQDDKTLRHVFKEPPLVAFRKAKTIRNEIVRSDLVPSPSMKQGTIPCGNCKATCHLIYEGTTITNSKEENNITLNTSYGNCKTSNIVYAARCKSCDLIYVGETEKSLGNRFSKHRYDAKKRPDNCELAEHIQNHQHNFETDIEITILKEGFASPDERKRWEDKFICRLGTISPNGLNSVKKVGRYAKEMYTMHQDMLS